MPSSTQKPTKRRAGIDGPDGALTEFGLSPPGYDGPVEAKEENAVATERIDRPSPASARPGTAGSVPNPGSRKRWAMVGLCFLGLTVNYVDRANLSVALPKMKTDLGLGSGAEEVVLAAFFASNAVFQLPAGRAVDRWGERIVNALTVAWWSAFTALTAAAQGLTSLILLRLALGAGEAGGYPSSAKAVSVWFPTRIEPLPVAGPR